MADQNHGKAHDDCPAMRGQITHPRRGLAADRHRK
jgi:hypothetical protein